MIPNVVKGSDMKGLLRYLVGSGRANEHTHPHVVSGDAHLQAWHGTEELGARSAAEIAAYLEYPRVFYGTEIKTKATRQNPDTGAREDALDGDGRQVWTDQHVWHCSLSLPVADGVLSAEQWDEVATEFADKMGLTAESGKAPVRWVAIHHGASKSGNDHIHIAASMVREDGTRWEGRFRDFPTAQRMCRELEVKHGLTLVDGRQFGTTALGVKPAERGVADRAGTTSTQRQELAARVRATAVAASNEAEWVRRVRADGMVIKPRFAEGSTDVVVGYRVALKPHPQHPGPQQPGSRADRLNFYGGGQLGRDLSLPRVRESWAEPSITEAGDAAAEWQAAFRGQQPAKRGREGLALRDLPFRFQPQAAADNLTRFSDQLAATPLNDPTRWASAARDVSGALSAWARYDPANADELRMAAAVIARSAQQQRAGGPTRRVQESPTATAMLFMAAKSDDRPRIQAGVLINQLVRTATAIRDYHRQTRNVRQAQAVQVDVIDRLQRLPLPGYQPVTLTEEQRIRAAMAPTPSSALHPPAGLGSPLPNQLTAPNQLGPVTRPGSWVGVRREGDRDAGR